MIPKAMTCKDEVVRFLNHAGSPANILWGTKLDGVRVMAVVEANGDVGYWSRNGKRFENFTKLNSVLLHYATWLFHNVSWVRWPVIFDGEMMPKSGTDDSLAKVMTQLRRIKEVDQRIFEYCVFDIIPVEGQSPTQLERYEAISAAIDDNGAGDVKYHRHYLNPEYFDSEESVEKLMRLAVDNGYEGLVIKAADAPYEEGRRSTAWCKVKPYDTIDIKVTDCVPGEGKHTGRLGALVGEFYDAKLKKTIKVQVGSGFSDDERFEFAHIAPYEFHWVVNLPSVVEVKFQERTKTGALRFPTFVRVRDDKDVEA